MSTGYVFNTNPVVPGERATFDVTADQIEGTPSLRRASLSNAVLFGGPLVRRLLEIAPIVGDRMHILVDTKVTMLMPGWWPAIPGWHTDGVPRDGDNALGKGDPKLTRQAELSLEGYHPRYHTIHVGNDCPTEFVNERLHLPIEHDEDPELYAEMTRVVQSSDEVLGLDLVTAEPGQWMSWDWWNIHRATEATDRGWRLLVRITESNDPPADSDFIRAQNLVYVPKEFGW